MKVKNPRDILKYQSKGITGLSGKQALFLLLGIALFFGIGLLLVLLTPLPIPLAFLFSLIIAAPALASAILKISGLYFSEVLRRLLASVILNRDYRPYKTRSGK